jgi:hypothetical protein
MAIKLVETPGWNAGARTIDSFADNGAFQFKVGQDVGIVCGLNDRDNNAGYTEIDHAFYVENGTYRIIEGGVFKTVPAPCPPNPCFRITRINGIVRYFVQECVEEPEEPEVPSGPGSIWIDGVWNYYINNNPIEERRVGYIEVNNSHPNWNSDWFHFYPGDSITIVTNSNRIGPNYPSTPALRVNWSFNGVTSPPNTVSRFTTSFSIVEGLYHYTYTVEEDDLNDSDVDYLRFERAFGREYNTSVDPGVDIYYTILDLISSRGGLSSPTRAPQNVKCGQWS